MEFKVLNFLFQVVEKEFRPDRSSVNYKTRFSLQTEGLLDIVFKNEDGTTFEKQVEWAGFMTGDHFEIDGHCFISPQVQFHCVPKEPMEEGLVGVDLTLPNITLGFKVHDWYMGNSGVN